MIQSCLVRAGRQAPAINHHHSPSTLPIICLKLKIIISICISIDSSLMLCIYYFWQALDIAKRKIPSFLATHLALSISINSLFIKAFLHCYFLHYFFPYYS